MEIARRSRHDALHAEATPEEHQANIKELLAAEENAKQALKRLQEARDSVSIRRSITSTDLHILSKAHATICFRRWIDMEY